MFHKICSEIRIDGLHLSKVSLDRKTSIETTSCGSLYIDVVEVYRRRTSGTKLIASSYWENNAYSVHVVLYYIQFEDRYELEH